MFYVVMVFEMFNTADLTVSWAVLTVFYLYEIFFSGGERPKVERIYCGHRSSVLSLAIDDRADGSRFASSSLDGQVPSVCLSAW